MWNGTCHISPFWHLQLGGGFYFSGIFVDPCSGHRVTVMRTEVPSALFISVYVQGSASWSSLCNGVFRLDIDPCLKLNNCYATFLDEAETNRTTYGFSIRSHILTFRCLWPTDRAPRSSVVHFMQQFELEKCLSFGTHGIYWRFTLSPWFVIFMLELGWICEETGEEHFSIFGQGACLCHRGILVSSSRRNIPDLFTCGRSGNQILFRKRAVQIRVF